MPNINLSGYSSSCDVIGVDPYPIGNPEKNNMDLVADSMDGAKRSKLPIWVVPQIFNWGTYKADNNTEIFKTFPDPTEEQMRSMTLLMALRGAKGFIFYSYFDLKKPPLTKVDFDRRWPKICRIAAMLHELKPFILADTSPSTVTIEIKQGKVQASEFRDNNDNIRILIAGIGPGEAKAIITTTAAMPLKSLYGKCIQLDENRYLFTGTDICSDILTGKR